MKQFLDWSAYKDAGMGDAYADIPPHGGNYAKAIAACINSRQCEADGKQVMCPSYRVSKNPDLSTGGRVRLLKAALSEDQESHPLLSAPLAEAMELCVSCKGCKRECEANVDMPLIKAEYLAQKYQLEKRSLRSRLFAATPEWLFHYGFLRNVIALRNRSPFIAKVSAALFGIDEKSPLPVPVKTPFSEPQTLNSGSELPGVVLFTDTFTRYFDPQIAEAAIKVLTHAGYPLFFATPVSETDKRPLCCGRTYLAQGMIDRARAEAERLRDALLPHVEAGRIIVGMEASCVLGLRDDALALGLGEDMEKISKQVMLFEEFLAKEIKAKRLNIELSEATGKSLVHGHCHQKATGAMKSMRRVLKQVAVDQFEMIDSGCCGMAGTFGLEREHAADSRAMNHDGLLQTLQSQPHTQVIANGFSCRQQIKHYDGRQPWHLAEYIKSRMQK